MFAPDDLELVKGGPAERRDYLDDLLVAIAPRYDAARADFDRVLKQRNALLRRRRRATTTRDTTLAVFDDSSSRAGGELVRGRLRLVDRLAPAGRATRTRRSPAADADVDAAYEAEWARGPASHADADAVERAAARTRSSDAPRPELDRGVTLVGPHRDEWRLRDRRARRAHARVAG